MKTDLFDQYGGRVKIFLEALWQRFSRKPISQYVKIYAPIFSLFVAYCVTGSIGLSLQSVHTFATLIWPPAGIALAGLVLYGYPLWPAVALGAFIVNLSVGAPPLVAGGIALGNTLEALIGAYFLKEHIGFNPRILRLRDNAGIIFIALFGTLLSSILGVASLWVGAGLPTTAIVSTWSTWWVGDVLGVLIFAPLIFKILAGPLAERTRLQYVELWAVLITVLLTAIFIFWIPQSQFAYYLFIPLTWAALRTGPRGTVFAIAIVASVAISGTLTGKGPFTFEELMYLQIFLGTLSALFLIFTAIIEDRKRAQALLKEHVGELEGALDKISSEDEAKKNFLAILSHELRNPLSAILSSVELLRLKEKHPPETSALLESIDERVRAMTVMLDDVLDLSRVSRNKLTLTKESVSLDSLIDRSVRTAQLAIRARGHTLSVIKPEHDLYLHADPIRIEQIFVNLLTNAAKYTKPKGHIEFAAKQEGAMVVVHVKDNGMGISKHMLERIFEPFFQIRHGKIPSEGLGIGLPLTRQLVELHQGSIEARSEGEGKGAEFKVRLPVYVPMREPAVAKPIVSGPLRRSKRTRSILIVDDNEMAAGALGRLLELRGHSISIAHNGSDALDKARDLHPEVVILDIGLPDMDGYEVARIFKRDMQFSSTLIALTGYGQPQDKERAREEGFQFHLTKPVGLKEIESTLRKIPRAETPS